MIRILLYIGGVFQAIFFLFHVQLGTSICESLTLNATDKSLMQMFNIGITVFVFFFIVISFLFWRDLYITRLGKATLIFISIAYFFRASAEIFMLEFSLSVFLTCVVIGFIYITPLFSSLKD